MSFIVYSVKGSVADPYWIRYWIRIQVKYINNFEKFEFWKKTEKKQFKKTQSTQKMCHSEPQDTAPENKLENAVLGSLYNE